MLGISHPTWAKRMAEAHAAPHRGVSVRVEIGASSLLPFLTCLDRPRRASDSLSSPQAGGAGRANGARLDGVARAWPARQKQANKFPPSAPAPYKFRNSAMPAQSLSRTAPN